MKISLKKKSKGKMFSTARQDYSPEMKEYIFAIKGRPFAMLSSQKLPAPPVSLIDYDLVRDLGLEMHDLQCTKYTFGGARLRILGRISQTLQTIQDGAVSGTAHVRANVVENLHKTFDTHSIAGQQVLGSLQPPQDHHYGGESPGPLHGGTRYGSSPSPRSPGTAAAADSGSRSVSSSPKGPLSTASPSSSPTPAPRSRPKVSSPKPLNGHHSTTYCRPQMKESPARGHNPARTLAVKPDDEHFYGRVVHIRHLERQRGCEVTMTSRRNNAYCHTNNPFGALDQKLQVGDLVLIKEYGCPFEAQGDGYNDNFPILMVYNDEEESCLHALGECLPDGPPDLHPGGFYG